MKPVCELIVQEILPSMRALVAMQLTKKYGLSQEQAALRLGTSQPAISQYKRSLRGYKTAIFKKHPKISEMMESLTKHAASGEASPDQVTLEFCKICSYLKKNGLLCEMHRQRNPQLEGCTICMDG
jgi:predicted transcriptional regulator